LPPLSSAPQIGLRELITRSEGLPSDTALDPLFLEYFLPILCADLTLANSFEPEPLPPLRCPLRVTASSPPGTPHRCGSSTR
jgi:medium-chain acyl-[acyl-carrier-protein] hydrolase